MELNEKSDNWTLNRMSLSESNNEDFHSVIHLIIGALILICTMMLAIHMHKLIQGVNERIEQLMAISRQRAPRRSGRFPGPCSPQSRRPSPPRYASLERRLDDEQLWALPSYDVV